MMSLCLITEMLSKELNEYGLSSREKTMILTCLIIMEYWENNEKSDVFASIATMLDELGVEVA